MPSARAAICLFLRGVQQGQDHEGAVGDGGRFLQAAGIEDHEVAAFHQVILIVPQRLLDQWLKLTPVQHTAEHFHIPY
jgi:hypothetical protein